MSPTVTVIISLASEPLWIVFPLPEQLQRPMLQRSGLAGARREFLEGVLSRPDSGPSGPRRRARGKYHLSNLQVTSGLPVIRNRATVEQTLDSLLASAQAGSLAIQLINHAERDLRSSVRARFHGDDQQVAPNREIVVLTTGISRQIMKSFSGRSHQ